MFSRAQLKDLLTSRSFFVYLAIGLFFRFYNLYNRVYFIWDQGRDAADILKILSGDITLIGPTSGLPGFYLGPLWYYIGVPGHLLFSGNPLGIIIWYVILASLALPLFWLISHIFFKKHFWQQVTAYTLALCAGSLAGSTFIWNPLLALPLIAGAVVLYSYAEKNNWALYGATLLWALTLHAEFAYAVFYVPLVWLLTKWIQPRATIRQFAIQAGIVLTTGLPQMLFELRHGFIMTKSLWQGINDPTRKVGYDFLIANRPEQYHLATSSLLFGFNPQAMRLALVLWLLLVIIAALQIIQGQVTNKKMWRLLLIFFVLPYVANFFWTGNYGYFFNYYLTAHFIFMVPLMYLGAKWLWQRSLGLPIPLNRITQILLVVIAIAAASQWVQYARSTVFHVENNAGLRVMQTAVARMYELHAENGGEGIFRIYTPNVRTEHYDYLIRYHAIKHNLNQPSTQATHETEYLYLLMEPIGASEKYHQEWYQDSTASAEFVQEEMIGVLKLEVWRRTPNQNN